MAETKENKPLPHQSGQLWSSKTLAQLHPGARTQEPGDVRVYINGTEMFAPEGSSIRTAARLNGINIPALCDHPRLKPAGKCRVCVVEVENESVPYKLSCSTKIKPDMRVRTDTPVVKAKAAAALREAFAKQRIPLKNEIHASTLEIQDLLDAEEHSLVDDKGHALVRDMNLCVDCTRCVRACDELQGMSVLESTKKDDLPSVGPKTAQYLADTDCISCGQCSSFCPTGAISERDDTGLVLEAMKAGKIVTLQTAPATRVAIAEAFDMEYGTIATGKLVAAARKAGFNYVFDTNFTADLTIMEEGTEFLGRLEKGGPFPMFTSCCPAWINMVEKKYPTLRENLSSCRSPQMMMGPVIKTYWAEKMNISPDNIFQVSMMPCTAKKDEIQRQQMWRNGKKDVDVVLTTREFAKLLKMQGIDSSSFQTLEDSAYDSVIGASTGAAALFGVTGGVMEAALRTAYEVKTGKTLGAVEFQQCRGLEGIKEAEIDVDGAKIKIAIASGGKNVRALTEALQKGEKFFHFVEMMACPCGCIGGGGQPRSVDPEVLTKRMNAIYSIDEKSVIRKSHENPEITAIYKDFFGKPNSHKSHELLHTHYTDRSAKQQVATTTETEVKSTGSGGILILYGSQGGTAANAAKDAADKASRSCKGVSVRCVSMDSYNVADLANEEFVLLFCSTFGDGEFPDNAKKFWDELSKDLGDGFLSNVKFAVAGLGDMAYASTFNEAAKRFDQRMEQLGATRVLEPALGDDKAPGKYGEVVDPLVDKFLKEAGGGAESVNEYHSPVWQVSLALKRGKQAIRPCPPGFHFVRLAESTLLSAPGYDREIRQFSFDLRGSGLTYACGDHSAILPRNNTKDVKKFCKFFGLNSEDLITVRKLKDEPAEIPTTLTVEELFCQYIDLFAPVNKKFLQELRLFASEKKELDEILDLIGEDAKCADNLKAFVAEETYESTLRRFPKTSENVPLDNLISIVPLIKPRLYSISSSHLMHPDTIQHTIVIYNFKTPGGKPRTGLCTSYLWSLNASPNTMIALRSQTGILVPPVDTTKPICMFGLGTGIGPFRGFLQQREAQKKAGAKLGPAHLWFACRHHDKDFVHVDEFEHWRKEGVLTKLHTAFSHDQKEFVTIPYVIDHDAEQGAEIAADTETQYFYCGPSFGIPETIMKSLENSLVATKKMTPESAAEQFKLVKDSAWFAECF